MNIKVTPCEPPSLSDVDNDSDLDRPRYVAVGEIRRDASGRESGEIRWEKHEVIHPVI